MRIRNTLDIFPEGQFCLGLGILADNDLDLRRLNNDLCGITSWMCSRAEFRHQLMCAGTEIS